MIIFSRFILSSFVVVLLLSCDKDSDEKRVHPYPVPFHVLLADPEDYAGKFIRTYGYIPNNSRYIDNDNARINSLSYLLIDDDIDLGNCLERYVSIEGVFKTKNGHISESYYDYYLFDIKRVLHVEPPKTYTCSKIKAVKRGR